MIDVPCFCLFVCLLLNALIIIMNVSYMLEFEMCGNTLNNMMAISKEYFMNLQCHLEIYTHKYDCGKLLCFEDSLLLRNNIFEGRKEGSGK